jgi:type II secretory pathway component PulM
MSATVSALQDLWHSREARERKLISIAALVLFLGGVYGFILDPAWSGLKALKTSLPAAQTQAAQVNALAAQVKANPAAMDTPNQTKLQASLSAANIAATVSAAAPWVVTVNGVSGQALWTWLRTHNASKTNLKRSSTGAWSGDITLEP